MPLSQTARTPLRVMLIAVAVLAVLSASVWLVHTRDESGTAAADSPSGGTVTVSGQGAVQGVPDTLTATFDVHYRSSDVQGALDGSSSSTRQVIAALRAHGVAGSQIETTDLNLNEDYDSHGNIDGYVSDETLKVRIHPLVDVGKILAAGSTAAGDHVRINGLSLDITDDTQLLNAARAKAFANAKDAASQDASLAGRQLGEVVSVKETRTTSAPPTPYYGYDLAAGMPAAKSVPIRAGKQSVSMTVNVVWSLQ